MPPPNQWTAAPPPESNGTAVAAMIVGILAIVTFWLCGLGGLLGLVAVVLGIVGLSNSKKSPTRVGRGQAIAGIVTGGLSIVLGIGIVALLIVTADDEPQFEQIDFGTSEFDPSEINTDPSDGSCNPDRFMQDPDC